MALILSVPPELIEEFLVWCHPTAVSSFSQTCHATHNLVCKSDCHLWRQLYLVYPFDDPRNDPTKTGYAIDWKLELENRVQAELILSGHSPDAVPEEQLQVALRTLIHAVTQVNSFSIYDAESNDLKWVDRLLRDSGVLSMPIGHPNSVLDATIARLRSYYALSLELEGESEKRLSAIRLKGRCFVYDLAQYHSKNQWSVYHTDGTVNWKHVEHVINVIIMNIRDVPLRLDARARLPVGLEATRACSIPHYGSHRLPADWAGVEGVWRRYICFMDYRDLFAYNYSDERSGHLNPDVFGHAKFREATRLIEITLRLVQKDELKHPHPIAPTLNKRNNEKYPPLFFSGISRGVNGNEAIVEGYVRIAADDTLRWSFTSILEGHTQWSSEGVQVGGIASSIGVVGTWTGASHSVGDPVGPFWFWKVEHDHPDDLVDFN